MAVPKKAHVVIVSLGFAGHFRVFQQLVSHLSRYDDVSVTVMSTHNVISLFSELQSNGSFGALDLRLVQVFGELPMFTDDPRFPIRTGPANKILIQQFEPFKQTLIAEKDTVGRPTSLIVDMYLSFTQELAEELEIPWFPFYSTSSSYALCCLYSPRLIALGQHPEKSNDNLLDFPGLEFCRFGDLVGHDFFYSSPYYIQHSEHMRKATGILMNSAEELEGLDGTLDALRTDLRALTQGGKVSSAITIGPIVKIPGFAGSENILEKPVEAATSACLQWLDTQPESSVLYICFGTLVTRSEASLKELAYGLESSQVPFLWVITLAPGDNLSNALPPDFQSKIAGRGFLETGWVPQGHILAHPSTGGFMTHCGWNSSLEALCTGVPVITWPQAFDQQINARFLVNVVKVGVALDPPTDEYERKLDVNAAHVEREAVERAVVELMVQEKGKHLRSNAQRLKTELATSVAEGGSSSRNMQSFLDQILHPWQLPFNA